jgi:carbonic anhydrase
LQFHVHTSSEHTINGSFFGAELHVVHKAVATKNTNTNRYAAVGFVIDPSAPQDNPLFASLLAGWSNVAAVTDVACGMGSYTATMANSFFGSSSSSSSITQSSEQFRRPSFNVFNVYDFVEGQSFYHYDGGFTTPPCSQVVWWNIASTPVKISVAQYQALSYLTLNYRSADTCRPATIASPSGSTSRPVQPMNGRSLHKICPVLA